MSNSDVYQEIETMPVFDHDDEEIFDFSLSQCLKKFQETDIEADLKVFGIQSHGLAVQNCI